jgi:hypothetical protein
MAFWMRSHMTGARSSGDSPAITIAVCARSILERTAARAGRRLTLRPTAPIEIRRTPIAAKNVLRAQRLLRWSAGRRRSRLR